MADKRHDDRPEKLKADQFTPKNIVLLSDGTGNSAAKLFRTNVWRIYEALDLLGKDQVAFYDDGVGTGTFKPIVILGGAFGYGLKRNVLDLYTFLCRNYKVASNFQRDDPNTHDKIFTFGFSRGAFTARVVAGLVARQGLICAHKTDADLMRLAKWAYRAYRAERYRNSPGVWLLRKIRNGVFRLKDAILGAKRYDPSKNRQVNIDFLGLFDTVAAYGLPVDELTRGWDEWVWPMLPRDNSLHERVKYGRHAVAIDDERQTFFPLLWDEDSPSERAKRHAHGHPADRIKQVWFAGMHSNVGGGYADDALSMGPLVWMAREAVAHGLRFQPHRLDGSPADPLDQRVPIEWRDRASACTPMSDSRGGTGAFYRYKPRPISELCGHKPHSRVLNRKAPVQIDRPKIHESVFERIRDGGDSYAPFGLPDRFDVITRVGRELSGQTYAEETGFHVQPRERVWDAVWRRRVVYFTTILTTLFLLVLPAFSLPVVPGVDASQYLNPSIGAIGGFLPGFAQDYFGHYQDQPGWFVLVTVAVGLLLWYGARLKHRINDRARAAFENRDVRPGGWLSRLRESKPYVIFWRIVTQWLVPNVFGAAMALVLFVGVPLRLTYQIVSRTDSFCRATADRLEEPVSLGSVQGTVIGTFGFYPQDICTKSGVDLYAGRNYAIQIAIPHDTVVEANGTVVVVEEKSCRAGVDDPEKRKRVGGWVDRTYPVVSTKGIKSQSGAMSLFVPYRRIWGADWFVPIAALGTIAPERHYLTEGLTAFTPTRTGPLSFYVNDAAIPLNLDGGVCTGWDCYYKNNLGGLAKIRVVEIEDLAKAGDLPPLSEYTCAQQIGKLR